MSKLIFTTVLAFAALAVVASDAEAAGRWRRWRNYSAAPAPVATAPSTTAQSGASVQGYRSFSYQPAAPVYRSYSAPRMQPWDYPKTDARRYSNPR